MTANTHGHAYQIPFMYYKAGLTATGPTYMGYITPHDINWQENIIMSAILGDLLAPGQRDQLTPDFFLEYK